jgi:hypothetical protein
MILERDVTYEWGLVALPWRKFVIYNKSWVIFSHIQITCTVKIFLNLHSGGWKQGPLDTAAT